MKTNLYFLLIFCLLSVTISPDIVFANTGTTVPNGYFLSIRPTTDSFPANSLEEITIGERTIFNIELQFPDNTINNNVSLKIDIPDGMMFLLTDFSPSAYQQFPGNMAAVGAYLSVGCGGAIPFGGKIEKLKLNPATDFIDNGTDVILNLGKVEVFDNGQSDDNRFCIDIETIVLNLDSNVGFKGNQKNLMPSVIERTGQGLKLSAETVSPMIEPDIEVYGSMIPAKGIEGDVAKYVLYIGHGKISLADAFNINILYSLDSSLKLNTNFGTDGLDNDNDGFTDFQDEDEVQGTFLQSDSSDSTLIFDVNSTHNEFLNDLPLNQDVVLTFFVTFNESVSENDIIENNILATWQSMNPDPFGLQREYSINELSNLSDKATLKIESFTDTELATVFPDVTIGEVVHYRALVTLPEISNPYLEFFFEGEGMDFKFDETFARFDTECGRKEFSGTLPSFTQWDIHYDQELNPDNTVKKTHTSTSFEFDGNIDVPEDGDPSNNTFCILYSTQILNDTDSIGLKGKQSILEHSVTVEVDPTNEELDTALSQVSVREPDLKIKATVDKNEAKKGDTILYTIDITHSKKSMMEAKNINIATTIDDRFTVTNNFGSDGLDNDGDGKIDQDDPEEVNGTFFGYFDENSNEFRFLGWTTDNPKLAALKQGERLTLTFYLKVNDKAKTGDHISQTVWLNFENLFLNGNNGDIHRIYQRNVSKEITIINCPFNILKQKSSIRKWNLAKPQSPLCT